MYEWIFCSNLYHPPWATIIEGELLNTVVDWELRVVKNPQSFFFQLVKFVKNPLNISYKSQNLFNILFCESFLKRFMSWYCRSNMENYQLLSLAIRYKQKWRKCSLSKWAWIYGMRQHVSLGSICYTSDTLEFHIYNRKSSSVESLPVLL